MSNVLAFPQQMLPRGFALHGRGNSFAEIGSQYYCAKHAPL